MPSPRESTNRLLELVEEGILGKDQVILACVGYMSEDDVADMCHCNEFFPEEEDEEEDEEELILDEEEEEDVDA